ncbi:E3 ubiquitin-protein ligase TRIM17-like [Colossoma macropomum]|uniref:E3 ubiquitin-protein ligase TRIM17-like n=1 Tax=Colossoma macropomum TaxID=42526 RepID=UPI001864D0D1|nr:E3 ubiquitin-protein ligase TRIM17-like [Colossoma macropomum]
MDSRLSKQIQCAVCLGDFEDPVSLLCDHTFCRQCISNHSQTNRGRRLCPECRRPYTMWDLRSNRVLRNMVDAVREHLSVQQALREQNTASGGPDSTRAGPVVVPEKLVCPDHAERLKLFCETDQKLVCLICIYGEKHQGHKFKPVDEAAEPKKVKAAEKFDILVCENETLVELIESQADEIIRTREQSKALSDQISEQFEQMHQFLRDKEDEVKALLLVKENTLLERMEVNLFSMEEMLSEVKVNQGVLVSALETDEPCQFLQWWTECGQSLTGETASSRRMQSPVSDVRVIS